jgi:hypothetical protein
MVSKLLLAVQECCLTAIEQGVSEQIAGNMLDHYFEIQAGIGAHKSPELYGAVPTDPYSHTPATKGAQQPGMTGQVKEDILSRFGELGIAVAHGIIAFKPRLLRKQEFLEKEEIFHYVDLNKQKQHINLSAGSLAFTYCQVPVVYTLSGEETVKVVFMDGSMASFETSQLDKATSEQVFKRAHTIKYIEVGVCK